jgi:hypothetical protein
MDEFRFRSELWRWEAQTAAAWYFVTVPVDLAEDIRMEAGPRGFGSIRVQARIGAAIWKTSIFPSSDPAGAFVLPVKKAVRTQEGIEEGDSVEVDLELIDD